MSASRALLRGFALHSARGLEFALVQDATGKDAKEIIEMGDKNRMLTALLRSRLYKEKAPDDSPDRR